ncbi:MAG: T9SS type A sorting domain-containing protein [Fluviicola sp.]|nr:T9SS type A sorting domain-containing protein [Fluviicola sp.]
MKSWFTIACLLFLHVVSIAQTVPLRVVSYNLLNFPNGRTDCGSSNVNPLNRTDTLRRTMRYLNPDILGACEIQTEAGCDSILTRSLNVFGTTHYQRANWAPNNSGDIHNMLFYNADKLVLKEQRTITTSVRNIDHYILYVIDPTLPNHHDTIFVEVFMCHLKAGSGTAEQAERATQTQILRQVLATRPTDRHLFVCGDLNTYRSSETCYQNLVTAGNGQMKDPINSAGNWTANAAFASVHTQSPRTSGSIACGSTGGMDDRFDHILVSPNVLNGSNLTYTNNSYKAIGNDGAHYNQSLLNGGNAQYPDSVVKAIYYLSDHLPVKMDAVAVLPTQAGLNLTYSVSTSNCSSNGSTVTINPLNGQAPFTYAWDLSAGGQTTQTVTGLQGGSYCVQVTDALGAIDNICFEITQFNSLSVSSLYNNAFNGCDGSAFVVITGGTAPYTVQWNDPANSTTESITNLCPGTYTCSITDANGCTGSETISITDGTSSLEEENAIQFTIYPNPGNGMIELAMSNLDAQSLSLELYAINGLLVKKTNVAFQDGKANLDLSDLKNGTYFIKLGSQTLRYIKQ